MESELDGSVSTASLFTPIPLSPLTLSLSLSLFLSSLFLPIYLNYLAIILYIFYFHYIYFVICPSPLMTLPPPLSLSLHFLPLSLSLHASLSLSLLSYLTTLLKTLFGLLVKLVLLSCFSRHCWLFLPPTLGGCSCQSQPTPRTQAKPLCNARVPYASVFSH